MTDTYLSYTRDAHLFNFDYKKDLHNCAVERDRVFITKKLREDSEESEDDLFEKDVLQTEANLNGQQPEADVAKQDTKAKVKTKVTNQLPRDPDAPLEDEQSPEEFPDEMPG